MKTQDITTTNLADFEARERGLLIDLLQAWQDQGLPDDFYEDEVVPMFNRNSGFVFLTNSEFHIAAMNGDKLESWYSCPHCSHEGFAEDCEIDDDGHCNNCKEGE